MLPIGLVMIVLTSADVFTSNIMFMTTAFLHRRITVKDILISWVVSYLGSLARHAILHGHHHRGTAAS
jgi:formate/nitrite transporter FocA (FNT family)